MDRNMNDLRRSQAFDLDVLRNLIGVHTAVEYLIKLLIK